MHIIVCLMLIVLLVLLLASLGPNILSTLLILAWIALGALAIAGLGYALYSTQRRRGDASTRVTEKALCPYCHTLVERDSAICPSCHRDLQTNCPSCGQIVAVDQGMCPVCRRSLKVPIDRAAPGGREALG